MSNAARPFAGISEVAKTASLLAAIVLRSLIYPPPAAGGIPPVLFYRFYSGIFMVGKWLLPEMPAGAALALRSLRAGWPTPLPPPSMSCWWSILPLQPIKQSS
jgi:hypothetical protein